MDLNADGTTMAVTVIVVNQEVIDLVVKEDRQDDTNDVAGDDECTVVHSAGPALDQPSTAAPAPAPLSIQGPLPTAEHPPSSTDDSVEEEERREEGEVSPPPPPKESGSHPVGETSSSSSTLAQIPPPGLSPLPTALTPLPPTHSHPPVLLPSQIVYPAAEAVTRFKPSPRDVISGIAPHVFDERRRRRSPYSGRQGAGGGSRRSSSPRCRYGYRQGRPRASPLRMSLVISLDDRSIYIEDASSLAARLTVDGKQQQLQLQRQSRSDSSNSAVPATPMSPGKKILPWTKFKLDGALFKTLVSRMKRRNPLSKAIQS